MDEKLKELFKKLELSEDVLKELSKGVSIVIETQVKNQVELAKETIQEEFDGKNEEWRETEIGKLEEKFEEYKETITSKFSDFTDHVIQEEIKIPDRIVEFARKGQIYEPIIEEFKTKIAIDQGLIDEETKSILKEARNKIVELEEKNDTLFGENLELQEKSNKLAVENFLHEKTKDLTLEQRDFVWRILKDSDTVEEIDEKFEMVLEQGYGVGGEKMEGKKTEGTKGPSGDDDAAKKKKEIEKSKGTGDYVGKGKEGKGSESDEETMGSQGDKKLRPKKETDIKYEDDAKKGKGRIDENEEDEIKKKRTPLMEEYHRLSFNKLT